MTEPRTRLSTKDLARAAEERRREAGIADRNTPDNAVPVTHRGIPPITAAQPSPPSPTAAVDDAAHAVLFPGDEASGFRSRWEAIQTGFVDEPRAAVEEADALVAQVVARLAEVFSDERTTLEGQWDKGDNISTEDLRLALRRYRSFFDRLLTV